MMLLVVELMSGCDPECVSDDHYATLHQPPEVYNRYQRSTVDDLLLLLTAIDVSLGGSSPYTRYKQNK
jgi:hypothetical protein